MSSFTPNIQLQLPPFGTENWNTINNSNFSALDSAIGSLQAAYQGEWASTVVYSKAQMATFQGGLYISIINSNFNNTPPSSSGWQLMTAKYTLRGAWTANTAFNAYDNFTEGGNLYAVLTPYTSGATFGTLDTTNAIIIAAQGSQGPQGIAGELSGTLTTPLTAPFGATVTEGASIDHATIGAVTKLLAVPINATPAAVIGEIDSLGNVSSWTDGAGVKHFEGGVVINGGLTLPAGLDLPTVEVATTVLKVIPSGIPGAAFEEADSQGNCSRYVDGAGNTVFGANVTVDGELIAGSAAISGALTAPSGAIAGGINAGLGMQGSVNSPTGFSVLQLSSGTYIVTATFLGRTNIYSDAAGVMTQLTTLGNNAAVSLSTTGTILFFSDRNGVPQLWSMNTSGSSQTLIATLPQNVTNQLIFGIGQSLMAGHNNTLLQALNGLNAFSFSTGPRGGISGAGGVIPAGNLTTKTPLVEVNNGGDEETMSSAFCFRQNARYAGKGIAPQMFYFVSALNGTPYSGQMKGQQPYTNALQMATAAIALMGPCVVPFVTCLHGEDDDKGNNTTGYGADLLQWVGDYNSDIRPMTGQWQSFPLITSQIASWGVYSSRATPVTPQQVEAIAIANPGVIVNACPKYMFPYTDGIHLTATGQRWCAEYYSKAAESVMATGDFKPLRPLSATISGTTVTVTFNVPKGPLVFDTTLVSQPSFFPGSMFGFEFDDGSGSPPAITAAAINGNQVVLTLAAAPTGSTPIVRYAWTTTVGALAGPTSGPRGNLRDSDNAPSVLGNTLYNWAVVFSMPV